MDLTRRTAFLLWLLGVVVVELSSDSNRPNAQLYLECRFETLHVYRKVLMIPKRDPCFLFLPDECLMTAFDFHNVTGSPKLIEARGG